MTNTQLENSLRYLGVDELKFQGNHLWQYDREMVKKNLPNREIVVLTYKLSSPDVLHVWAADQMYHGSPYLDEVPEHQMPLDPDFRAALGAFVKSKLVEFCTKREDDLTRHKREMAINSEVANAINCKIVNQ